MSGPALERVLQKLTGIKTIANGYVARCPAHDDQHASLQISERDDLSVGLHCHAGCEKSSLLSSMGLNFSDLFAAQSKEKQIVATYDYRDLTGTLLYQAVRYFPKAFAQRRPNGNGWDWNMLPLKGKHVAYRLPDLKGHTSVYVVEGEKDADRLWKIGLPATCNIGGAKKWGTAETKSLQAAGVTRVYILPDNDEAGQAHAEIVAKSCKLAGIAYSTHPLPHLMPHGDVSDWLMNGGSKDMLVDLVTSKPVVVQQNYVPEPIAAPEPSQPGLDVLQYHLTDLGAAESLRDRFGDQLRYDHQREQWLIWDGHFWKPDIDDAASRFAYDHVRQLQADAIHVPDFLERKKYIEFAMGREKRGPLVSMLQHASALKPIAISGDQWDADGMILGCPNGIVDLTTGTRRDGAREDFVTLQAGVPYHADADCPRWIQFLDEVFDGNAELIDYIHRATGYSLTADMREQCFFVAYGSGSNGKSIFIDALEHIFGTYGHRADMRMFAGHSSEMNSFQNADFRGKRLVFAAEVKPNSRMNEHVLKHLTGGESLRAEHKYGRSFTIRPVGKIWLSVNHRPKVADDSFGFWRRVRLIPFLRTFTGSSEDRMLKTTLRNEAEGIFAWAVRGCLEWQTRGLKAPQVVQDATNDYQQDEDPLANFFDEHVFISPDTYDSIVPFQKLYMVYREWASNMGYSDREKLTNQAFARMMQNRPFERIKQGNTACYKGFELIGVMK